MLNIYIAQRPWRSRVLLDGVELKGVRGVTIKSHVSGGASEVTLHLLSDAQVEVESGSVVFVERDLPELVPTRDSFED